MSSMYKRLWWTPRWKKGVRVSRSRCCPLPRSQSERDTHIQAHTYILSPQEKVTNTNTRTREYAEEHTITNPPTFKKHDSSMPNPWMRREEGACGKIMNFVLLPKPTFCPVHIWGCNSISYRTPKSQRLKHSFMEKTGLQLSVTPVPEDLMLSSDFCGHCTHVGHRHERNTRMHVK